MVDRPFLRRAVEAFFRRWPYYLVLLVMSPLLGISGLSQIGTSYTSDSSLFIEPRTLIESQSADEYEGYLARFTGSGFVVQDIRGLIRTDAFMASVAEKAGYEFGESQWERGPLFFELRFAFSIDTISDHLVSISASSAEAADAQALAQALVDSYIEFQISSATAESLVAEAFFDDVTESLAVELQEARDATDAYAIGLPSLRVLPPEQMVQLERLREAEAEAAARFRAAVDGSESARLVRARAETLVDQRFSFVNPPSLPGAPDEAGLAGVLSVFGFVLVGLTVALIGPVISAVRVRTLMLPDDLDGELDVPVLASVPEVAAARSSLVEPAADGGRSMTALRSRRTTGVERVVHTAAGEPLVRIPDEVSAEMENLWVRLGVHRPSLPSSLLLTAKLSGEGVSSAAMALATVTAGVGRTLLVEANDLGSRLPGLADRPGLTDVLIGSTTIDEAVVSTDQPGLAVLPVGASAVPGRLGSSLDIITAGDLIDALEVSYDLVIVDAPALAQSALALTLAGACDASLLVVRHGVTDIDQVRSARAELGVGSNLLGVVLTGTRLATPRGIRRLLGSDA